MNEITAFGTKAGEQALGHPLARQEEMANMPAGGTANGPAALGRAARPAQEEVEMSKARNHRRQAYCHIDTIVRCNECYDVTGMELVGGMPRCASCNSMDLDVLADDIWERLPEDMMHMAEAPARKNRALDNIRENRGGDIATFVRIRDYQNVLIHRILDALYHTGDDPRNCCWR